MKSADLDDLEKQSDMKITLCGKTVWAVNCFKTWLAEKQLSINLKHREITNELSVVGFLWLRSDQLGGTLCYLSLWAVLNRHINEPPLSRSWNLMQDPEFVSIVKQIRWSGRDRTSHYPPISSEDQQILKRSAALDPGNPKGLLNKLWYDIQLHFGETLCMKGLVTPCVQFLPWRNILARSHLTQKHFTCNSGED